MRIDANALPADATLEADVCVVGAGAAGIALALELESAGIDVCLLESGRYEPDPATQDLYRGEIAGRSYFPLESARLRWFGGTTNHWAGHCPELTPADLEARPWIDAAGWPISWEELSAYYPRAGSYLELPSPPPQPSPDARERGQRSLPFDPDTLVTTMMRFSPPTRFGRVYRERIEAARHVRLVLGANVTALRRSPSHSLLERVEASTFGGNSFSVLAQRVVLAAGGIENARLLLVSNDVEPNGLGLGGAARWLLAGADVEPGLYAWPEPSQRGASMAVLSLAERTVRREQLGGFRARLDWSSESRESSGWQAARVLREAVSRGRVPDDLSGALRRLLGDFSGAFGGLREEIFGFGDDAFAWITCEAEQRPDPENRVTLSSELDPLGLPRVRLHWRISEDDFRTLERGLEIIAHEVGRASLGRVQVPELETDGDWRDRVRGAWHHMGTTRMGSSPRTSVVDAQCRVHGLGNLYVAGSSVFPTGGASNPTLTIVALVVRLADHLRSTS
jgi:choline dehydrogenase-like flavoprotein